LKKIKTSHIDRTIAIIALVLSFCSIGYTVYNDRQNNMEHLAITFTNFGNMSNEYLEKSNYVDIGINGFVGMNYGIIISNNSNKKVSIVRTDIESVTEIGIINIVGQFEGLFTVDLKRFDLPLVLDAGESKQLIVRIKLALSKRVVDIIISHYQLPNRILYSDVKAILYDKNIDIYSNDIRKVEAGSGEIIELTQFKFPEYLLTLRTANNNVFRTVISIKGNT